ncbi:MAG: hypothetical protein JO216_18095 [Hyphomicrobiales bacterium]|nr:hypothetical protein [Hyphomicrobiales bacterium]
MHIKEGGITSPRIEPRFEQLESSLKPQIAPADASWKRATLTRQPRFNNVVARNWRGELPLWVSYWVIGFIGNLLIGIIPVAVDGTLSGHGYDPRILLITLAGGWLAIAAVSVWQGVGVWRSADARIIARKDLGRAAPWAILAKLAVFVGLVRLIALAVNIGAPQMTELSRMAFFDDPDISPYALRIMRNGTELEISGGFKFGLNEDLVRLLRAAPKVRIVHLDSTGGRIGEAVTVYNTIQERKLITYVSHQCMSACTVAFVGGQQRWLYSRAQLGFHAPTFPGISAGELADATEEQREIFSAVGIDRSFVDKALSTPNNSIWLPPEDELLRSRVITNVSDGSNFAASGFGANLPRDTLAAQLKKSLAALSDLERVAPDEFNSLVDDFLEGYQKGQTEAHLLAQGRQRFLRIISTNLPLADDPTLIDFGKLMIDQYTFLNQRDPSLCYQYAAKGELDPFLLSPTLREREAALDQRVLQTAAKRPTIPAQILQSLWGKVISAVTLRVGRDNAHMILGTKVSPAQYGSYCEATIAFYQEIIRLREPEAAELMRQVLAPK